VQRIADPKWERLKDWLRDEVDGYGHAYRDGKGKGNAWRDGELVAEEAGDAE